MRRVLGKPDIILGQTQPDHGTNFEEQTNYTYDQNGKNLWDGLALFEIDIKVEERQLFGSKRYVNKTLLLK